MADVLTPEGVIERLQKVADASPHTIDPAGHARGLSAAGQIIAHDNALREQLRDAKGLLDKRYFELSKADEQIRRLTAALRLFGLEDVSGDRVAAAITMPEVDGLEIHLVVVRALAEMEVSDD